MRRRHDTGDGATTWATWRLLAVGIGATVAVLGVAVGAGALLGGDDADAGKHEGHGTGPIEFDPLPADQQAVLDGQWDRARTVALRYPTVRDALDAGFEVAQANEDNGAHLIRWDRMDDTFSIDEPEQLLYRSEAPDAPVMALSYQVVTDSSDAPEGFESDNDVWHEHRGVCLDDTRRVQGMDISADECATLSGRQGAADGWMLHVWILPGWENPDGIYAPTNPTLRTDA